MPSSVFETTLSTLSLLRRGKVRDVYELDANRLLIIATDRLSAYDVVLPDPVPAKGKILSALTLFWFRKLPACAPHHLLPDDPLEGRTPDEQAQLKNRSMVVKRLNPLPVEAVVRGYLSGSGWRDYQKSGGEVCGIRLPPGLKQFQPLPEPMFTPASKAPSGKHDENITYKEFEKILSVKQAAQVRKKSIQIYEAASQYAWSKGILLADTKFEFGIDSKGEIQLIDEVLTPDSSRFWRAKNYWPGEEPASLDKQFVRDYLEKLGWDKNPPPPQLPQEVIQGTQARYLEIYEMLTAEKFPFLDS